MVEKTELILICLVAVALLAIVAWKIRVPYPILLTIGGVVCVRSHHLAAGRGSSAGGHSKFAGAPQDYCHPRRRESDKRRHFFYLVPFRSGRRDDRRFFAGASKLAISFCRRGRHMCWSRRRLAGNTIAKAFGRSAGSNNVLPSYAVRCLL